MKIDRLIGILSILLQKEMVTVPEIAEHFEVSPKIATMWMLTFGEKVEVIEPIEVREKLKRIAKSMIKTNGGKRNG